MKRNDGFTLIELLVTISVGTLVTFAAMSLLLLGARVQYNSTQEAEEQQTVRIVMSLLEEMAGKGAFNEIVPVGNVSWQLWNCENVSDPAHTEHDGEMLFEYNAADGSIYRGEAADDNAPLLTGLNGAIAIIEGKDDNILRLSFETEWGGNYTTRVYCRTGDIKDNMSENDEGNATGHASDGRNKTSNENRIALLNTLASQYGSGNNVGQIIGGADNGKYYSQWYIGADWGNNGWNKDTPWCACFLSWAAVENGIVTDSSPFVFANVDEGAKAFIAAALDSDPDNGNWKDANATPTPGDYVFFDWSGKQKDPAHVGVVLDVDTNGDIYTIEGNSSGRVAVRKYEAGSEAIMGYGVLPGF